MGVIDTELFPIQTQLWSPSSAHLSFHLSEPPLVASCITPGFVALFGRQQQEGTCLYHLSQGEDAHHSVVSDSFVTPWPVARQVPLTVGSSRQEYWSGLPFPSPGDLPDPGIEPASLASPAG